MTRRQKALIAVVIAAMFGGGNSTTTKLGLQSFPPLAFGLLRFVIASILVSFFLKKHKQTAVLSAGLRLSSVERLEGKKLILVSLLATTNVILFITGMKTTNAVSGGVIYAASPLVIGIFAHFLSHEKLNPRKLAGIIIGLLGVVLITLLPILTTNQQFTGDLKGNLLITLGMTISSLYSVFTKKLHRTFNSLTISSAFIFLSALVFLVLSIFESGFDYSWVNSITFVPVLSLLYYAAPGTVGLYIVHQQAIRFGGAITGSMMYYLLPLFSITFATILLKETLTPIFILSASLALLGVYLVTSKKPEKLA